ncbi:hypothetical protein D3C86_227660 [compost metagenome]
MRRRSFTARLTFLGNQEQHELTTPTDVETQSINVLQNVSTVDCQVSVGELESKQTTDFLYD